MSEVRIEPSGVHVLGGVFGRSRFVPWDALLSVDVLNAQTILTVCREDDRIEKVTTWHRPEIAAALREAWHADQIERVVGAGRFVGRLIPERGTVGIGMVAAPLGVAGLGLAAWVTLQMIQRLPEIWTGHPSDRPAMLVISSVVVLCSQLPWLLCLALASVGWSEHGRNRAWRRVAFDRRGVERVDADGRRYVTPWARVGRCAEGWRVDGVVLPIARLSGGRLALSLLAGMTSLSLPDEERPFGQSSGSIALASVGAVAFLGLGLHSLDVISDEGLIPYGGLGSLVALLAIGWAAVGRPWLQREEERFEAEAVALVERLGWRAPPEETASADGSVRVQALRS